MSFKLSCHHIILATSMLLRLLYWSQISAKSFGYNMYKLQKYLVACCKYFRYSIEWPTSFTSFLISINWLRLISKGYYAFYEIMILWFLFKRVPLFKTGVCSDLYNTMYWSWQSTFLVLETKLIGGEPLHLCLSGGIPVQIRAPNCWWSVTSFLRWPIVGVYYLFESKVKLW